MTAGLVLILEKVYNIVLSKSTIVIGIVVQHLGLLKIKLNVFPFITLNGDKRKTVVPIIFSRNWRW